MATSQADRDDWERDARRQSALINLRMLAGIGDIKLYGGQCFEDIFGRSKRKMAEHWHVPRLIVELADDYGIDDGLRVDDIAEFNEWLELRRITLQEVQELLSPEGRRG